MSKNEKELENIMKSQIQFAGNLAERFPDSMVSKISVRYSDALVKKVAAKTASKLLRGVYSKIMLKQAEDTSRKLFNQALIEQRAYDCKLYSLNILPKKLLNKVMNSLLNCWADLLADKIVLASLEKFNNVIKKNKKK